MIKHMADDDVPQLALPGASAAFARVAAAVAEEDAALLTRVAPEERAQAVAASLLAGIAEGRAWDDAWVEGPGPAVADDHLVAALLAAAAALMHLGAAYADIEPAEFLRQAMVPPPD
jgi:hypothetical protein